MKSAWPTVFLDQWVWIRFAAAAKGRPRDPDDARAYEAVGRARDAGVVFPLSATRYEETGRIRDPQQRQDLADVVAPLSELRALRAQSDLIAQQILTALHETLGRPTFRPSPTHTLGVGAHWAFTGRNAFFKPVAPGDRVAEDVDGAWLRQVAQFSEYVLFAGPSDAALPGLVKYGYVDPRDLEASPTSRLERERALAAQLEVAPQPSATLLRFLQVRELWSDHRAILARLAADYRLSFATILPTPDVKTPFTDTVADFIARVPTPLLAAQMKHDIFRQRREWTWNMLRDIEAMTVAIPYCDVVMMDKDAVHLAGKVRAPERYGTRMITQMGELVDVLPDMEARVSAHAGEPPGWSMLGPYEPFHTTPPRALRADEVPAGAEMRLVLDDGQVLRRPVVPGTGTTGR
jgi:hypothetical protein